MLIYTSNVRACIRLDEDSQEEITGDQEVKCQRNAETNDVDDEVRWNAEAKVAADHTSNSPGEASREAKASLI
jgi:hypothetical protein